jgi:thiol-disulfide isomerase/thioredoxin
VSGVIARAFTATAFTAVLGAAIVCAGSLCLVAPATAFEFKPYSRGSFADVRKAHANRPLVVHFWSVTCAPCIAELPNWAKIAREKQNVDIVFVNADRNNDRARAENRLDKAGLKEMTHFGFADEFLERLYFEVDHYWRGELPFTALVAADGELVTVIGSIDEPAITGWMEKADQR